MTSSWNYLKELLFVGAAMAAIFALLQWYLEADDRARERLVQEIQVLKTCLDPSVAEHTNEMLSTEGSEIAHGERDPGSETTFNLLVAKCSELGIITTSLNARSN